MRRLGTSSTPQTEVEVHVVYGYAECGKSTIISILTAHPDSPHRTVETTDIGVVVSLIHEVKGCVDRESGTTTHVWVEWTGFPPPLVGKQLAASGVGIEFVCVMDLVQLGYVFVKDDEDEGEEHHHPPGHGPSLHQERRGSSGNGGSGPDETRKSAAGLRVGPGGEAELEDVLAAAAVADVVVLTKRDLLPSPDSVQGGIDVLAEFLGGMHVFAEYDHARAWMDLRPFPPPEDGSSLHNGNPLLPYVPFREYKTGMASLRFHVRNVAPGAEIDRIQAWIQAYHSSMLGRPDHIVYSVRTQIAASSAVFHGRHPIRSSESSSRKSGARDPGHGVVVVRGWKIASRALEAAWRESGEGTIELRVMDGGGGWSGFLHNVYAYCVTALALLFLFAPRLALSWLGLDWIELSVPGLTLFLDKPGGILFGGLLVLFFIGVARVLHQVLTAPNRP